MEILERLRIWNVWTLSAEGILVSPSAKPESVEESQTRGIFGRSSRDWFASFDPATCCWKTSQATFLSDLEQYSETWPDSGTMRNGRVYELRISEPPTCERGSSSWPTARVVQPSTANQSKNGGPPQNLAISAQNWLTPHGMMGTTEATGKTGRGGEFAKQVTHWPTPTEDNANNAGGPSGTAGTYQDLTVEAAKWATPQEHDKSGGTPERVGRYGTEHGDRNLADDVTLWQTPATDSFRSRGGDRKDEMGLDQQERFHSLPDPTIPGGQKYSESDLTSLRHLSLQNAAEAPKRRLNPRFVEWLMNFPIGWTEL